MKLGNKSVWERRDTGRPPGLPEPPKFSHLRIHIVYTCSSPWQERNCQQVITPLYMTEQLNCNHVFQEKQDHLLLSYNFVKLKFCYQCGIHIYQMEQKATFGGQLMLLKLIP